MSCNEIGQPPETEKRVTVSQGDDYAFQMAFKDANGVAINLSGWTFNVRCKKPGNADVVWATAINAASGIVTATITDTQTAAMIAGEGASDPAGRWTLHVIGTDNAGLVRRYVRAWFQVIK